MEKLYTLPPAPIRSELQRFEGHEVTDELRKISCIKLVEERDYRADRESDYECWKYAFGESNARRIGIASKEHLKMFFLERPYVDPRVDDVAIYLGDVFATWDHRFWRVPKHVGRVIDVKGKDITVRSKFGFCDVFEHPINFVPEAYGKYAKFVRVKGLFDGY